MEPIKRPHAKPLTPKQGWLLLAFVTCGDNPVTGQSNNAAFWVSSRNQKYRGLWRRGLLQIVAEHPYSEELRYDITAEGRRVAARKQTPSFSLAGNATQRGGE